MNRNPTSFILSIGHDFNDRDNWPVYDSYILPGIMMRDLSKLTTQGYQVKVSYVYRNGVVEERFIVAAAKSGVVIPTPSPPTPPPPPPPPPPPAGFIPSLKFNDKRNSGYLALL